MRELGGREGGRESDGGRWGGGEVGRWGGSEGQRVRGGREGESEREGGRKRARGVAEGEGVS